MELTQNDLSTPRAQLALENLASGIDNVFIDHISINNTRTEGLVLTVWSAWSTEHLTRDIADAEIRKRKESLERLSGEWPELERLIAQKTIPCFLHDDYGMGGVRICELKEDGKIEWHLTDLK